jgi:hypothetical protein
VTKNYENRFNTKTVISNILDAKDRKLRQKQIDVAETIYASLQRTGKIYNCGGAATWVDSETRKVLEIVPNSAKTSALLIDYGIMPETALAKIVGRYIEAKATTTAKKATIYTLGFYDQAAGALYVNEHGTYFLKITARGIERIQNGDDDMLFADGEDTCEPLQADLAAAAAQAKKPALSGLEDSLLEKYIFSELKYPQHGIGRENARLILILAVLGLFLRELMRQYPNVYFVGPGASLKTSLAWKIGLLLVGQKFQPTSAKTDENEVRNLLINRPFVVVDEANNLSKLENLMRMAVTGGEDMRRKLYTTDTMQAKPFQARLWMTANTDSLTNEANASRQIIIDAGAREEEKPYRSTRFVFGNFGEVRNAIWTELVGRLAAAVHEIQQSDLAGAGDLNVASRLSDFFVIGHTLASAAGLQEDMKRAELALKERQERMADEGNEFLYLMRTLPISYNARIMPSQNGGEPALAGSRTLAEWQSIIHAQVPDSNRELKAKAARLAWVRYQIQHNEHTLRNELGMIRGETRNGYGKKVATYAFTGLEGPAIAAPTEVLD